MSSTKCPACGLTNFSSALVCRRCSCPLLGEVAAAMRANLSQPRRLSYRWAVNAVLSSIAYAVLLFFCFFLFTVIPNAMYSSETGWTDYTEEQLDNLKFWYWISLTGGVILIFLFFLLRRDKYYPGE